MRRLWLKFRLPIVIFSLLVLTLAMARLFSGPEDTWVKNEQGEWVKHGYPSGPPPSEDYQEPKSRLIIPLGFLAGFLVPLIFIRFHKPKNNLTYEIISRDMKIMGYLSIALPLIGIIIMIGIAVEIAYTLPETTATVQESLFNIFLIFSLMGFSGLCILLGSIFYALKRNCNDHYQIERSYRELIENQQSHSL
ncbi:hypothetical protein ACFL6H_02015 [Candidatus Latescibacterota bacterium]